MSSFFDKIASLGQVVDKFDMQLLDKEIATEDIDFDLISIIEDEFDTINENDLGNDEKIPYYYTLANYQSLVRVLAKKSFELAKEYSRFVKKFKNYQDFVMKNYTERIDLYRKAAKLIESGTDLNKLYTSQVYINYANLYLEMGRTIESVQLLINGNKVTKGFPMAKGNLALKHNTLANCTTDESVKKYLLEKGLAEIIETADNATEDFIPLDILDLFYDWELFIENRVYSELRDVEPWSDVNDSGDDYKKWCAKNQLSLNYINVIYKTGNIDELQMPNMGVGYFSNSKMEYYSWFNTIKQEYNMARYFLYQIKELGMCSNNHESQVGNVLINTLDYPATGYKTEMLKIALKTAFSVLDKIGMFCCKYFNQDLPVHKIDFQKWYKEIKIEVALNSPFNSLYWLSQDLDTNKGAMKEIKQLRNALEHRFIRVLESYDTILPDELADRNKYEYTIEYYALEDKAMETLKIVRSAIFYMASGFNIEYNRFYENKGDGQIFLPMLLTEYEDDWKN